MNAIGPRSYLLAKHIMYPGWDFGARARKKLVKYFLTDDVYTLDAGCGNALFSLEAYKLGNRVLGISFDAPSIERCQEYVRYLGVDQRRINFLTENIYNSHALGKSFDQIICFETLEHLRRDREVVQMFGNLLHQGGLLHLCVPYKHCPFNIEGGISETEDGGHVRIGYTYEEIERLMNDAGIEPLVRDEIKGWGLIRATAIQRTIDGHLFGKLPQPVADVARTVMFFLLAPLVKLGSVFPCPPWSIYVCGQRIPTS